MSSIFPSGLSWNYNGTLKTEISQLYRDISMCREGGFASGALNANYFELSEAQFFEILSHFTKLMDAYQAEEEEIV